MSEKMTREYIHGYYLDMLKGKLEGMKQQYENEQKEKQNTIDSIALATNAYLTGREMTQNFREKTLKNLQQSLNINTLDDTDEGYGKTWDWDEPGDGLSGFIESAGQKIFGWDKKVKGLDYNKDGVVDEKDRADYKSDNTEDPLTLEEVEKQANSGQANTINKLTNQNTSNNDIESETPDSEVVDYGDPNVDSSFEVEDDDYGFGESVETENQERREKRESTLPFETAEDILYNSEHADSLNVVIDTALDRFSPIGLIDTTSLQDYEDDAVYDDNPNKWNEDGTLNEGYDENEWYKDDDGNWQKIPEGERVGSINDNEKSGAMMALNNIDKPADTFKELMADDLIKRDKLKKGILGGLV